ncbi:hypothetical protein Bhyg_06162 [Pseudolycoriella hygida]|uniref:Protein sleepless n=1 Tax=Pseudolycoriella hygida TaxID=35572 RepID=A0A9Q0N037_9DIPT|nr:hypothetical protein Bhyg_06162 [Pseudolycoriella hygida]
MLQKHCLFTLMLVSTLYGATSAIMCYECNSQYDPRCGLNFDPFSLALVNCSLKEPPNHLRDLQPEICRKITQKIFGKYRVIRSCGYIKDEVDPEAVADTDKTDGNIRCKKRSGTFEVQSLFCSCDTDECNAAPWSIDIPTKHMILVVTILPSLLIKLIFEFSLQKSS